MNKQSIAQNRPFGTIDFPNPHSVIQRELLKHGFFVVRDRGLLRILPLTVKVVQP
jgi:hypothetical protein